MKSWLGRTGPRGLGTGRNGAMPSDTHMKAKGWLLRWRRILILLNAPHNSIGFMAEHVLGKEYQLRCVHARSLANGRLWLVVLKRNRCSYSLGKNPTVV